jgi:hypothetical protein
MPAAPEESVPERVTRKQAESGRSRLQVDRQTKASYATYEAAEKSGTGDQETLSDPSGRGGIAPTTVELGKEALPTLSR